MRKTFLLCFFLFVSCSKTPDKVEPFTWEEIQGREESALNGSTLRHPVYRMKVPKSWKRLDPGSDDSLVDTTQPNTTFVIEKNLKLTVHSFPNDSWEERIPSMAQIERWKNQLKNKDVVIEEISHSGFTGHFLKGENGEYGVMGWSLSLDSELYQNLLYLNQTLEEREFYRQLRADVTLKVTGPKDLLKKHRKDLLVAANSFELIQSLP